MWVHPQDQKIVGSALAAARHRSNLTQDELASRLQKPQSFVSDFERGQRRIDIVEFVMITRALDANPIDLFTEIAAFISDRH